MKNLMTCGSIACRCNVLIVFSVLWLMACSDKSTSNGEGGNDSSSETDTDSTMPADTDTAAVDTGPSACADGIDNDSDGLVDWQHDLGCANANDDDETAGPRDEEDGFTTFDPPANGNIYYVANDGSDGADGLSPETALATIAAATARVSTDGGGGWVLLKRADVFNEPINLTELHGSGIDERVVFAGYGDATERPVLQNASIHAIKTFDNIAVVGIDVHAEGRNPDSANYVGAESDGGFSIVGNGSNILVEGCRFWFDGGSIQGFGDPGLLTNVEFRRNVVHKAYSVNSHSSGLYTHHIDGLLVEGNVFDHNGWLIQQIEDGNDQEDGQATFFNHNMYLSSCDDVTVRNNLILRGASMGIKMRSDDADAALKVDIEGNVFYDGEIGVGFGGNTDEVNRFAGGSVINNSFLQVGLSRPTNRTLAWAIDLAGHNGLMVSGNLVAFQDDEIVTNSFGVNLVSGYNKDITIKENIFYRLNGRAIIVRADGLENIAINDNIISQGDLDAYCIDHDGAFDAVTYRNNQYATGTSADNWFRAGSYYDYDGWVSLSGEAGASNSVPGFEDSSRDLATYNASIGGTADAQDFIDAALNQSPLNWDPRYTAQQVNAFLFAGFSY